MVVANALNINQTGLVKLDGTTGAFTATTTTNHAVLIGAPANAITNVGPIAATGAVLQSNGATSDPGFSTATYPSIATGTGTILRADGTNWVATTATYPNTTTSQQILYSTAANTIGQLTTANSALVATNSSGTLAMRLFSTVIQVFTGNGTYTPTSGMLYAIIEVQGSGGAGGGAATTTGVQISSGTGGGGGEYARGVFSAATVGASQAVTVGAGGTAGTAGNNPGNNGNTTSVGALITAAGGTGGPGGAATATGYSNIGGAGGTGGSGGSFRVAGTPGGVALNAFGTINISGRGGSSFFGHGAIEKAPSGAGNTGQVYGSGGSGACNTISQGNVAGGVGAAGIVVITEFVIA